MLMDVKYTQNWAEDFFADFVSLRNRLYRGKVGAVEETLDDMAKEIEPIVQVFLRTPMELLNWGTLP